MWNFVFLPEGRSRMPVYLFWLFVFFSPGMIVSTLWSYNVARGLFPTEMKSSSALFKCPKNGRALRPPLTIIIFPKSTDQNSEIAILFNVVEKPYVFGDDLLPHTPRGTGYKLQTLTSAYI